MLTKPYTQFIKNWDNGTTLKSS